MKKLLLITLLSIFAAFNTASAANDEDMVDAYNAESSAIVTDDLRVAEPVDIPKEEHSVLHKILMWIPNRVMDIVDIFRVDVGVGPAIGAGVRVTKYGQLVYRTVNPSVRVGDFGRQLPVMIETSNEIAVGPSVVESKDRKVCPGEVGVGADLFVAGAYGGICLDQVLDFVGGIFFLDPSGDDM